MSSQLKIRAALLSVVILAASRVFCSEISEPEPAPKYEAGKRIFKKYCKVCHGDRGDGRTFVRNALKTPPADFTAKAAGERLSPDRMKRSVLFGRSGTAMVSWKNELSIEDIDNVILFIRSRFMKTDDEESDVSDVSEKGFVDITGKYSGRIKEGRRLYEKHCYHCHGKKGDSKMPVNDGLKSPPRNFTDPLVKETLQREQMFYSIRDGINGTAMVSWRREFSGREIIDIIKYIQTRLMRPDNSKGEQTP